MSESDTDRIPSQPDDHAILEQLFVVTCQALRDRSAMQRSNEPLVLAFSVTLRALRERAGLTQEDLAERADTSVRFISLLETGRRQPSLSAIAALSEGLGLNMVDVMAELEARYRAMPGREGAEYTR